MSAFADLMDLQERIDALTREMAGLDPRSAAYSEVLNEIGELELVLHAHNSARLRPRTESILRGLGFKDRDFDRDCGEFSGGWQMRIALAKLLPGSLKCCFWTNLPTIWTSSPNGGWNNICVPTGVLSSLFPMMWRFWMPWFPVRLLFTTAGRRSTRAIFPIS